MNQVMMSIVKLDHFDVGISLIYKGFLININFLIQNQTVFINFLLKQMDNFLTIRIHDRCK